MLLKSIAKLFSVFLLSSAFMMSSASASEKAPDSVAGTTKVSAEDVIDLVGKLSDLVIIDARKSSDRSKGYIEGSIGLPNTETTPDSLAKHLANKSTPVVFFCNGEKCGRSVESAKIAVAAGYTKVYWFRGGWDEWTGKGLPVMKD